MKSLLIVARFTFIELIRGKILWASLILGVALAFIAFLMSQFTFGSAEKVGLDTGLSLLSVSAIGIAIFLGVNLVANEIEQRTIYPILTRPVRRYVYLLGKVFGLQLVLLTNVLILGVMTLVIFFLMGGSFDSLLIWSIGYSFLEASLILSVVTLFSLITNPTMSAVYAIIILILGHGLTSTLQIGFVESRPVLAKFIKTYLFIFPNFSRLNVKDFVLYGKELSSSYLWVNLIYGVVYSIAILTIAAIIFQNRNLD